MMPTNTPGIKAILPSPRLFLHTSGEVNSLQARYSSAMTSPPPPPSANRSRLRSSISVPALAAQFQSSSPADPWTTPKRFDSSCTPPSPSFSPSHRSSTKKHPYNHPYSIKSSSSSLLTREAACPAPPSHAISPIRYRYTRSISSLDGISEVPLAREVESESEKEHIRPRRGLTKTASMASFWEEKTLREISLPDLPQDPTLWTPSELAQYLEYTLRVDVPQGISRVVPSNLLEDIKTWILRERISGDKFVNQEPQNWTSSKPPPPFLSILQDIANRLRIAHSHIPSPVPTSVDGVEVVDKEESLHFLKPKISGVKRMALAYEGSSASEPSDEDQPQWPGTPLKQVLSQWSDASRQLHETLISPQIQPTVEDHGEEMQETARHPGIERQDTGDSIGSIGEVFGIRSDTTSMTSDFGSPDRAFCETGTGPPSEPIALELFQGQPASPNNEETILLGFEPQPAPDVTKSNRYASLRAIGDGPPQRPTSSHRLENEDTDEDSEEAGFTQLARRVTLRASRSARTTSASQVFRNRMDSRATSVAKRKESKEELENQLRVVNERLGKLEARLELVSGHGGRGHGMVGGPIALWGTWGSGFLGRPESWVSTLIDSNFWANKAKADAPLPLFIVGIGFSAYMARFLSSRHR